MDTEFGSQVNEKKEVARLVITMFDDSSIKVEGSIGDKVLAYGLLACAKDAIFEHHLKLKTKPKSNGMIDFVRGRR